jgi:hypothetical protein
LSLLKEMVASFRHCARTPDYPYRTWLPIQTKFGSEGQIGLLAVRTLSPGAPSASGHWAGPDLCQVDYTVDILIMHNLIMYNIS